jgi:hypothetical protein
MDCANRAKRHGADAMLREFKRLIAEKVAKERK